MLWTDRMFEYMTAENRRKEIVRWERTNGIYRAQVVSDGFEESIPWPLPNLWLGVTAENQQRADERIPVLLQIPAAVRFVSVEPMLGPVDSRTYMEPEINNKTMNPEARCGHHGQLLHGKPCPICFPERLNWVICGGESGPGAKPMLPDWARSLRDQCQAAGVPFFFKQWGEWAPAYTTTGPVFELRNLKDNEVVMKSGSGGQVMKKVGKKAAGRLLDGQEWSEFPS